MATSTLDGLRDLFRHMEWADASVWRALRAHPAASEDARVRYLVMHMHGVQRYFLQMWRADASAFPTLEGTPDFEAIQAWVTSYYSELTREVDGFDEARLTRTIDMPHLRAYEKQMGRRFDDPTLAETMVQVATHSTYHRGQLNTRLREIGGEPPLVDYIAWIVFGRPAPEWAQATRS
jgi:uncharacterized damage-inducible protein DinB